MIGDGGVMLYVVRGLAVIGLLAVGRVAVPLVLWLVLSVWRGRDHLGLAWGRTGSADQLSRWARVTRRGVRLWGIYVGWFFIGAMVNPKAPPEARSIPKDDDEGEVIA